MGLSHKDYRYTLVDTDYINYAVIYSCLKNKDKYEENAFILSRKRYLDEKTASSLKTILSSKYSIDTSQFSKTEQSTCS